MLVASTIFAFSSDAEARKRKTMVSCSEADAEIIANGISMGKGSVLIIVPAYAEVTIEFVKTGFLRETITLFNKPNHPYAPKTYHMKMRVDDAYEASKQTDIANVDLSLPTTKPLDDAWQVLNRVILSYMDVIETTDKETGYIRTAWTVQNFTMATVRTRIIVKQGTLKPLAYKFKLVSEIAFGSGVSPKDDQLFKEWDRVLRKFEPIATELPSRMK